MQQLISFLILSFITTTTAVAAGNSGGGAIQALPEPESIALLAIGALVMKLMLAKK